MIKSTKLLAIASFLIVILGFSFLWFGLKSTLIVSPTPAPIIISTPVPEASSSATLGVEGERAVVLKVVDGDTISAKGGPASGWEDQEVKIRLVGIDTPETVDPRRPVGCFGKEASNETKSLLSGKAVILQKDVSDKDKYGRILRYVFLPLENGEILFVNDYLVREGFAKVYTYPPDVKFNEQFRQAETEAKINKRGLWGKC